MAISAHGPSRICATGCSIQQSGRAPNPPWDSISAPLLRPVPAPSAGGNMGMCTHGSGLWDMARLWLRYNHSLSLASSVRQLCTAACMPWRVMTAPYRGLGSHSDLRATHQHRQDTAQQQGCLEHSPIVHVEEELEVELVHHTANLLPVTLHQLRVVHQLLLWRQGWRSGQVLGRHPAPPVLPAQTRRRMLGNAAGHSAAARQDMGMSHTLRPGRA